MSPHCLPLPFRLRPSFPVILPQIVQLGLEQQTALFFPSSEVQVSTQTCYLNNTIPAAETFCLRVKMEKVSLPKAYGDLVLIKLPVVSHKAFCSFTITATLLILSAPLPRAGM